MYVLVSTEKPLTVVRPLGESSEPQELATLLTDTAAATADARLQSIAELFAYLTGNSHVPLDRVIDLDDDATPVACVETLREQVAEVLGTHELPAVLGVSSDGLPGQLAPTTLDSFELLQSPDLLGDAPADNASGEYAMPGMVLETEQDFERFLAGLAADIPQAAPVQVHGCFMRTWGQSPTPSWNHAKIIAADGKRGVVGGHNL